MKTADVSIQREDILVPYTPYNKHATVSLVCELLGNISVYLLMYVSLYIVVCIGSGGVCHSCSRFKWQSHFEGILKREHICVGTSAAIVIARLLLMYFW